MNDHTSRPNAGQDATGPVQRSTEPELLREAPRVHPLATPESSGRHRSAREGLRDWLSIVQSAMTIAALLCAGLWFAFQGPYRPRLEVHNLIAHRRIPNEKQLIVVNVTVKNVGIVRAQIPCVAVLIDQVLPIEEAGPIVSPPSKCPHLEFSLEPGEADRVNFEYVLTGNIRTVKVTSIIPRNDRLEYRTIDLYDLT